MKKRAVFILIGLLSGLTVLFAYRASYPFFQHLDNKLKDYRFVLRGPVSPPSKVVIIAIDDKSINELGQWPWSHKKLGELVKALADYGVGVTALDIVFSEPDSKGGDVLFSRDIKSAGNVVLGFFFRDEIQPIDPAALAQLNSSKIKLLKIDSNVNSIPINEFKSLTTNIAAIGEAALDYGFFNQSADSDGVFRKSPLLLLYGGDIYQSLALKALRHSYGSDVMLDVASFGVRSLTINKHKFPVNENGELTLNYYGPTGSFRTFSATDILNRRIKPNELKGSIAFVGATEMGIYDIRNTPFDPALPGVEIHATVAGNSIDNNFIKRDAITASIEICCIFLLPLILVSFLSFVPGTLAGLGLFTVMTALFIFSNYSVFSRNLMDLTIFYPLLSIGLSQVASEAYRNLVVERKGRSLKKAFSSYVSPDLVKLIEKNPDNLILGGEQRLITILFSDIRGFTSISEGLTPQELVCLLNEYLNPMTRIVMEEKGTLDKFIGDAVMAIFNAPLDLIDHPEASCRAALRMIDALGSLNRGFKERNMTEIDIGIGINTGLAVVGNMGADIRFDYTAIGDSVNLASRLEGLNKFYGTHILVSEDTRNSVRTPEFCFREVDRVKVKGKSLPVVIYELVTGDASHCKEFESALSKYREGDFRAAASVFAGLSERVNDSLSKVYLERCREYILTPPPEDWDGVFTAKSK